MQRNFFFKCINEIKNCAEKILILAKKDSSFCINTKIFIPLANSYEQSDGQKREEEAVVNNFGSENESIAIRGSFSFVADDGQTYTVTYIADENGFQPSAAHSNYFPAFQLEEIFSIKIFFFSLPLVPA
jgi:Insect cuticle protein